MDKARATGYPLWAGLAPGRKLCETAIACGDCL